jgi:hypothetical protein
MESGKPQVYFRLTKKDYLKTYKKGGGENCVASDFRSTLLSGLVEKIERIDGLPVVHVPKKSPPSKSRGVEVKHKRKGRFRPDDLQPYSVCDAEYVLSTNQHNMLCLLRGILKEWLPDGSYLGKHPLPEIDDIVDRVLRSLETPSSCGSDSDEGDEAPPPKRYTTLKDGWSGPWGS